jgi:hypothetical protein
MFESMNELVWSAIIVVAGGMFCVLIGRWLMLRPIPSVLIYIWHSLFGFYFANYVLINGGDALVYYERARFEVAEPGLGTQFIVWITSIPVSVGLTYWPISLFYNLMGAIGVLLTYAALRETVGEAGESRFAKALIALCVLVPSFSFWTSGIGKDSTGCLTVGLFLWSAVNFERRQTAAIAAVTGMLCIRPHIAVLMVGGVAIGTLFASKLRTTIRFGVPALAAAVAVFAVPLALVYSGTAKFSSLTDYISDRQGQNLGGGSSIDLAGMNRALRFFTFLYRPLPNEAISTQQLASAVDNLFLITLTIAGIYWLIKAGAVRVFRENSIALIYGIACAGLLSQVTANLGIATRQKWMMIPALMLAVVSAWKMAREEAARKSDARRTPAMPRQALR